MISETRDHIPGRSFGNARRKPSEEERQKKDAKTSGGRRKPDAKDRTEPAQAGISRKLYRFEESRRSASTVFMRILKTAQGKQSEQENNESGGHTDLQRGPGRDRSGTGPGGGVRRKIKHIRAQGECQGTDCRRRTWQAALSHGEPQAGD